MKVDCGTPRLPSFIGIMMIIVNAGCIPFVEPFFSNIETYFFLDIIRTFKVINL